MREQRLRIGRTVTSGARRRRRACGCPTRYESLERAVGIGAGDSRGTSDGIPGRGSEPQQSCIDCRLGRRKSERRSEEHTSELQSPYVISYAVFCLKKKEKHKAVPRFVSAVPEPDGSLTHAAR